jgi:nondiscriminating glutamyl-tRNA synthetase
VNVAGPVRVRFAPSPTGWLHVGGARTALFNWLFARKHRGAFVIRVEDTDEARSSPDSERGVLDDLRWLGLAWDESPDSTGGGHGPYRQSERLLLYRRRADELLERGLAYPCFCTDAELEQRRRASLAAGRPPHYDGRCRDLDDAARAARRAEGRPESLRFRMEPRDWSLEDLVRGTVMFPAGMVGDFVLLRANGFPTYNFACVVDDLDMRITHVLRAEEHLSNTVRQLMLYQAFQAVPPLFGHLPLILNPDRTKMSKREGEVAVAVGEYRAAGYLPEALDNYLALLGFHPASERELFTLEELVGEFDLARVNKAGAIFDLAKLRWFNAHYLHALESAALRRAAAPFLPEAARTLPPGALERLLVTVRGNLSTLADVPGELEVFLKESVLADSPAAVEVAGAAGATLFERLATRLESLAEWRGEQVKSAILEVGRELGLRGKELFQPVRAALTGRTHGPELPLIAEALGRERTVARLREAAARVGS